MRVRGLKYKVYWWEHQSKLGQYSSAKVHRSLSVKPRIDQPKAFEDYVIELTELEGLKVEIVDGL
ncbi:hypothetical protein J21TS3_33190 [Paenibacillus cookii]|uniref:Transposase n=1 Tax=Paenibacillus cookii TaxID=157839 RepID=A0ABQ4LZC1_9BACL|nr:hypothetical protein J21TS3_33190 [Paenibacillus cookii]